MVTISNLLSPKSYEKFIMYHELSDTELLNLIFTEGDRLGFDYVDEAKKRQQSIVPLLCDVLTEEENYQWDGTDRWWSVIHAVYISGILGDSRSIDALLKASRYAQVYGIDWLWDALSECYSRIGPAVIPKLKEYISEFKSMEDQNILCEIIGLWNLWETYPETRKEIEEYLYTVLISPDTTYDLRADLIGDFAQINRTDLKPLFEEYYEKGEVELETLSREDLDYFFDHVNEPPAFRYDIEAFYRPEEIEKRQERWLKEDKKAETEDLEDYILENYNSIGRNEKCPCGSGKKFKKCHLPWAEETLRELREKEARLEPMEMNRYAVTMERQSESAIRRFLTSKGMTSLFQQLKEKALEVIKAPADEFKSNGFMSYFEPIFSQITFESKEELEDFTKLFMDYYNALAHQYLHHPRDEKLIH